MTLALIKCSRVSKKGSKITVRYKKSISIYQPSGQLSFLGHNIFYTKYPFYFFLELKYYLFHKMVV